MTLATDIFSVPKTFAPAAQRAACSHCGSDIPPGLIDRSADEQFCCAGCQAVYSTLHACGLEDYYRLRAVTEGVAKPANPRSTGFESFDSPTFHTLYVQTRADGSSVDLALEGVSCAACVWLVEKLPRVLPGVVEARLSLREAMVRITWDGKAVALSRIALALDRLGYTPFPARSGDAQEIHRRETRRRLIAVGIAGAIMGNSMLLALALYAGDFGHMEATYRIFFRCLSAAFGIASLAGPGATFFKSALAAIRARTTNLDIPIALALLVGGVAGLTNVILNRGEIYFDSLTVLVFLLLVGRFIQYRQQRRANDAVGLLFSLTPSTCHRVQEDALRDPLPLAASQISLRGSGETSGLIREAASGCATINFSNSPRTVSPPTNESVRGADSTRSADVVLDVPIEAVRPGDLVEVRAGELFPVDGIVEHGTS
jgi:Cu2+-exporting ATPase